jgi:peptidyl-prolyl cis-trans isomerase-like 4
MSVLLETSKGEIVIDLCTEEAPTACLNFLKLCKLKYYNDCKFFKVMKDYACQSGDRTNTGRGGESVFSQLIARASPGDACDGDNGRFFRDEFSKDLRHDVIGTVSCANFGAENTNNSQFLITLRANMNELDEKHTIFGRVMEGLDVLERINEAYCDEDGKPWQNIRIKHTVILDDPFEDPKGLDVPNESPKIDRSDPDDRLEDDFDIEQNEKLDEIELEKKTREQEARSRAVVLEMIGDLPDVDAKPPEESLFVCKLNPVTTDEDLEIIFSRFGKVTTCDVIRDRKTGDSLCYAFINFETKEMCEAAYFKMDNALIDDRRIHVDFSQSMHGLWKNFRKFGKAGGTSDDMANAANANKKSGGSNWQASRGRTLEVKERGGNFNYNNSNSNRFGGGNGGGGGSSRSHHNYAHVSKAENERHHNDEDRQRRERKRRDKSRSRSRERSHKREKHRRKDESRSRSRDRIDRNRDRDRKEDRKDRYRK